MDVHRSSMWQSNRGKPISGGQTAPAKETPYWMVAVLKKTPLTKADGGLRFAAEAVLLPFVLLLLADSLRAEEAPRSSKRILEKQKVAPRSKLVQSYQQEAKCERLQTSGPPWLVKQTQSNPVTCLYTSAWEQKHRPLQGVNLSLTKCNLEQRDQTPYPEEQVSGRAKLSAAQSSGAEVSEQADCQWASCCNGTTLCAVLERCNGAGRAYVLDKRLSAGASCGQKAELDRYKKGGALVARVRRKVIGAAAAVRQKKVDLQKRLKVNTFVPNQSTNTIYKATPRHDPVNMRRGMESASEHGTKCTVYRQRVGPNNKVERGAEMPGLLVDWLGTNDSTVRNKKEAGGRRVILAFSREAAMAFDLIHEGGFYLLPAPRPSLPPAPNTDTQPSAPSSLSHASLPVVDFRIREPVHSFSFVGRGPATDSRNGDPSLRRVPSPLTPNESLVIEVPYWTYGILSTSLERSLNAKRAEETARETKLPQAGTEPVRLRGRVTSILRLQLAWGCPYCGSSAPSDVRELPRGTSSAVRCGCIHCCTEELVCTVLLREACFGFDDGTSQCEVWANGEAAAALLGLPYEDVKTRNATPPSDNLVLDSLQKKTHCNLEGDYLHRTADHDERPVGNGLLSKAPFVLEQSAAQTDCSLNRTASAANPSKTLGQVDSGANSHQHQQQAAAESKSLGVKRLHSSSDSIEFARRKLLDNVNKRPKLGRRHEPDLLWRNLHRCILDLPKLEALVCREGLVEVKANPDGAADGSFQASKREMIGRRTGQLAASDREILEVLLNQACGQGQKVISCLPLRDSATAHTCFQRSDKCSTTGADRCRVYLSGQVYEIYAPKISRYRALKAEPVSFSTEAAALSRMLSENA